MMMMRIPVRFERVAAAFDADIARVRPCESSGSDHSPESSNTDLSDLVKSFMEKNIEMEEEEEEDQEVEARGVNDNGEEGDEELFGVGKDEWSGSDENKEKLRSLFEGADEDDRNVKERIRRHVEAAYASVGDKSLPELKRRLMTRLREKGFDAGLCKSKWERNGRFPRGDYEYIDINMGRKQRRYIVEVNLAGEFEIARPTNHYSSLLDLFPVIFVGKVDELKKIVRLMCTANRASMKRMDLSVPPWRRHGYVQAKWFSSYRRTTNEVSSTRNEDDVSATWSLNGFFEGKTVKAYNCRDDYGNAKAGFRVGLLSTALNS